MEGPQTSGEGARVHTKERVGVGEDSGPQEKAGWAGRPDEVTGAGW